MNFLIIDPPMRINFKKHIIRLIDTVGNSVLRRKSIPETPKHPQRILLVKLDHIGDVLMTTPAIEMLRQAHPDAQIDVLVKQWSALVMENNPDINHVHILNAPWTCRPDQKDSWLAVLKKGRQLRGENYDVVVTFRGDLRENFLLWRIGSPIRVGYFSEGGGFFLTHDYPLNRKQHEVQRMATLLYQCRLIPAPNPIPAKKLALSPEITPHPFLAALKRPIIGIHPGAASARKCMPAKKFADLIVRLHDDDLSVILLGGPDEQNMIAEITSWLPFVIPVLDDQPSLLSFAKTVQALDLLICHDSAPMHIAEAMGTPLLAIYGPTHEAVTGPISKANCHVFSTDIICRPCWLPGTPFQCFHNFRCFHEMYVDDLMSIIFKILR